MDTSVPFYLSYAALWILVIFQSMILLGLVRIVYQLQRNGATASLTAGQEAPPFSALTLSGATISTKDLAGRLTALLFVSPSCSACSETLADMAYLRYKAQGNIIVICKGGREDCARLVEKYEINLPVVTDEDDEINRLYSISSLPTAVLISADNRIQSYGHPKSEELEEASLRTPAPGLQGAR